jgi:hypothetical protein
MENFMRHLVMTILVLMCVAVIVALLALFAGLGMELFKATGPQSPKFRYNQTVHVSQGFYAGNTGTVTVFERYPPRYYVKVSAGTCEGELLMIAEEDLEEVQEAEKQ